MPTHTEKLGTSVYLNMKAPVLPVLIQIINVVNLLFVIFYSKLCVDSISLTML